MTTNKRRILCVEDHEDTRLLLTHLLESEGRYVIAAENATVGLALAQTQPFDLLILDVWLPDGDGNKLCQMVRAFDHYTPIVIYSGVLEEAGKEAARAVEADAFIPKPDIEGLLEKVKYFLE